MTIKPYIEINVPKGMYCGNCCRKVTTAYDLTKKCCEVFISGYLKKTSDGRYLKCEKCALETLRALEGR